MICILSLCRVGWVPGISSEKKSEKQLSLVTQVHCSETLKVNYEQLEVDKGSLMAVANLEKLTLRVIAWSVELRYWKKYGNEEMH